MRENHPAGKLHSTPGNFTLAKHQARAMWCAWHMSMPKLSNIVQGTCLKLACIRCPPQHCPQCSTHMSESCQIAGSPVRVHYSLQMQCLDPSCRRGKRVGQQQTCLSRERVADQAPSPLSSEPCACHQGSSAKLFCLLHWAQPRDRCYPWGAAWSCH